MKSRIAGLAAASLMMIASPVWADVISSGWFINGRLGTNWSSDLGVDFSQQVHHDPGEPDFTNKGTTTPLTPYDYEFSNQGVVVSLETNQRGLGLLGGRMSAFAPAAGDIEGKVYHLQIDLHTPPIDQYGMFVFGSVGGPIFFSGFPVGFPTTVYWGFEWRIAVAHGGSPENWTADMRPPGVGAIGRSGLNGSVLDTFDSGLMFGSSCLNRGDGGCTGNGFGTIDMVFSFELGNPAGSSDPGAAATLDAWITFSAAPVTEMPSREVAVPEPGTYAMLLTGLGLLGFMARRRKLNGLHRVRVTTL